MSRASSSEFLRQEEIFVDCLKEIRENGELDQMEERIFVKLLIKFLI
jgi:hypothetical protein